MTDCAVYRISLNGRFINTLNIQFNSKSKISFDAIHSIYKSRKYVAQELAFITIKFS
jgi:hypothetical protein